MQLFFATLYYNILQQDGDTLAPAQSTYRDNGGRRLMSMKKRGIGNGAINHMMDNYTGQAADYMSLRMIIP